MAGHGLTCERRLHGHLPGESLLMHTFGRTRVHAHEFRVRIKTAAAGSILPGRFFGMSSTAPSLFSLTSR